MSSALRRESEGARRGERGAPSECKVGAYLIIIERVNLLKIIFQQADVRRAADAARIPAQARRALISDVERDGPMLTRGSGYDLILINSTPRSRRAAVGASGARGGRRRARVTLMPCFS
ncbi:hypothetical protein EVAR_48415_1 [Eumeta japonica]|uniref:Uncharacterized protein n=1 Tax=Eumeta variegata TaxID=151549 RepID=A0A4C1XRN9_EUMVA|nr:hypothetical protein EVAR_48415_1 [Eumeta japonica]